MNSKRMGEIALAIVKYRAEREPITLNLHINRPEVNKKLGVTKKEFKEFAKVIINEIIDKQ